MVGAFVFTQHDRTINYTKTDAIAVGDYNIDAHMAQRVVLANGSVTNEGCLSGYARAHGLALPRFHIPYRVLVPIEVGNLLVRRPAIVLSAAAAAAAAATAATAASSLAIVGHTAQHFVLF